MGSYLLPPPLLCWAKLDQFYFSPCFLFTKAEYGRVSLDTTERNAPMLVGNLVSILSSGAIHGVLSLIWPQDYDWNTTKKISTVEQDKTDLPEVEFEEEKLKKAKFWIVKWGIGFTAVIVILWPALSLPAGVFSVGYFTFWTAIALAWGTIGSVVIIVLPITESWSTIVGVFRGMFYKNKAEEKLEEITIKE